MITKLYEMSMEHGSLLNFFVEESKSVESDFTLIMDPDFFPLDCVVLSRVILSGRPVKG